MLQDPMRRILSSRPDRIAGTGSPGHVALTELPRVARRTRIGFARIKGALVGTGQLRPGSPRICSYSCNNFPARRSLSPSPARNARFQVPAVTLDSKMKPLVASCTPVPDGLPQISQMICSSRRRRAVLACAATALICPAVSSRAQKPIYFDYPQATATTAPLQWHELPRWVSMDFELRGRTEGQTSYNQVSANDRIYELTRVRGGLEVRPVKFFTGYLQFEDTHALGLPLPSVAANMRDVFDLFQGYGDLHVGKAHVIAGRQLLRYGSERLVGISDWTNNSRSWDGFRGRYGFTTKNFIDVFSTSVVAVHASSLDKHGAGLTFHGAVGDLATIVPRTEIQPFVFIRAVRSVTSQQNIKGTETETTFGAEVNSKLPGGFDYDVLGALQRGSYSNDSIQSGAGFAKVGYRFNFVPLKPRLVGEYDYATGNDHSNATRISTFDQQYPSNHNAFGLVDVFGWQNITQTRLNLDVGVRKNLTLLFQGEDLHVATVRDNVYSSSGATYIKAPTAGFTNNDLGQDFDASGNYVFRKSFFVQMGVGHLFPGRVLAQGGKAPPLTLGYLQLTYRFKVNQEAKGPTPGEF